MAVSQTFVSLEESIKASQKILTEQIGKMSSDPQAMSDLSLHRAMLPSWCTWLKEESSGKSDEVIKSTCYMAAQLITEVIVNTSKDRGEGENAGKLMAYMIADVIRGVKFNLDNIKDAEPLPGFSRRSN
jgi:hypothetical protein